MNEIAFDFKLQDFSNIEVDIKFNMDFNQRYCKPAMSKSKNVKYKNASELSKKIKIMPNERYYCIIDGSFIFGDFIEAFIVDRNMKVKELTISTLSMSQENVDSFCNLIKKGYIRKLNLIVSDYFYSHEKKQFSKIYVQHIGY